MPREEEKGGGKKGEIHTTGRWKKKTRKGSQREENIGWERLQRSGVEGMAVYYGN